MASNKYNMIETEKCKREKRNEIIDTEEEITFI